jgi:hypothetical protein
VEQEKVVEGVMVVRDSNLDLQRQHTSGVEGEGTKILMLQVDKEEPRMYEVVVINNLVLQGQHESGDSGEIARMLEMQVVREESRKDEMEVFKTMQGEDITTK